MTNTSVDKSDPIQIEIKFITIFKLETGPSVHNKRKCYYEKKRAKIIERSGRTRCDLK